MFSLADLQTWLISNPFGQVTVHCPQSEQEKYLIQIIKNYEPSADHDAQMDELFAWGEQEPDMWQVTTSFHPVIR